MHPATASSLLPVAPPHPEVSLPSEKPSEICHGDHSLKFANVWSNDIFTDICEGRNSILLSIAVQESRLFLEDSDIILMPVHQKDRNQWSFVGIYN